MKRVALALAIAALPIAVGACGSDDSPSSGGGGKKSADEQVTVGVAYAGLNQPFFAGFREGVRDEAKKLNVKLSEIDGKSDTNTQANGIQDLVAQQPDGVLITPNDAKVGQRLVDKVDAAGIPIVAAAQLIGDPDTRKLEDPYPKLVALVTQAEVGAGEKAGELAAKNLPKDGPVKIAIVEGQPGYAEVKQRTDGFKKALRAEGIDYTIVASQPGDWVRDKGKAVCENIAASNPDVDLYFAHNDEMGVGCADALKGAGRKAKIIGVGGSKGGIAAIKAGTLAGTVCYKPGEMGRLGLRALVDYIRGTGDKTKGRFVSYDTPAIDKSNVDDCVPQW